MTLFNKIFKNNLPEEQTNFTSISRTEILEGLSIPAIIHNMQYHFIDLQVYSDGLISCWEMVDLQMFKNKLNNGWVVTSIPDGETISIFGLGLWKIEHGEWKHNNKTFYDFVFSIVKKLNPSLENLYDYKGNNSKKVGNVKTAKHFIPDPKPYYSENPNDIFPENIYGEKFHFFFKNDDNENYLVELSLYKNGHIEITNLPQKRTFKFEQLEELIEQGILFTNIEIGEKITILNLGSFTIKSGNGVEIESKFDELTDKFNELNGRENSVAKCARIFDEYKENPTKNLRNELLQAYESVPKHLRIFVGNMDTKDYEVRQIIYGDKIKDEWEAYYGFEYPYEDMPKPKDE